MKRVFHLLFCVCFLASFSFSANATWSIIVIDPVTKEIGIAGASCTPNVYGIGGIIPGKGAVIVQAMSNKLAQMKGLQMIMTDANPDDILKAMLDPMYDPEEQQYAIISMSYIDKPVTYTGSKTTTYNGALVAKGISVQGNTLSDSEELQVILNAALKAQKDSLSISEILMKALEAGSVAGGDKRCGAQKATSAFIIVAKSGDQVSSPYLNLVVKGIPKGEENAVEELRKKYDAWRQKN
ncbi:MAG: DUF1028 domain-containing protein [Chitinophagaceae bacterium]